MLQALKLEPEEWEQVERFLDLLSVCAHHFLKHIPDVGYPQHAENAQHAFSLEQGPTLHLAIPALEALHKAWSARISRDKYADFVDALSAATAKIEEYYNKTEQSPAYTFVMCESFFSTSKHATDSLAVLDPSGKGMHLKKYWSAELYERALIVAEEIVGHALLTQSYSDQFSVSDALHRVEP